MALQKVREFITANTMPLNSCVKLYAAKGNNTFKTGDIQRIHSLDPQRALMFQCGNTVPDVWGASKKRILQGEWGKYMTKP